MLKIHCFRQTAQEEKNIALKVQIMTKLIYVEYQLKGMYILF